MKATWPVDHRVRDGVRWLPVSIHDLQAAGLSGPAAIVAVKWARREYKAPLEDVAGIGTCVYLPDLDGVGSDALACRVVAEWRLAGEAAPGVIACECGVCGFCLFQEGP